MRLKVSEILFGFSTALDAVEGEIIGAATYHSQRVAFLASLMGRKLGLTEYERLCVTVASVLHDNGLTQYAQSELQENQTYKDLNISSNLGYHCILGEDNVSCLPIYEDIQGAVLYHHEQANGEGPMGKMPEEIPLAARLIHIADIVDVTFHLGEAGVSKLEKVRQFVTNNKDILFDTLMVETLQQVLTEEILKKMEGEQIVSSLYEEIDPYEKDYSIPELIGLADMFAKIIDFKSPFTTRHSRGIAEKAKLMGEYYGWDEETCNMLYMAGAVHDVGKLFVDNDILEKPGKLTIEEYKKIQNHAIGTYVVLSQIHGLGALADWANNHHEKLDGSGYPFGKTAKQLDQKDRLMACIDIYQALVEPRPYKEGMTHEKAMGILYDMAEKGQLDKQITADIDTRFQDWVEPGGKTVS